MTSFKSPCQEVFKTPLTLVRSIIKVHLFAVQSSEIFKFFCFVKIFKIPQLCTATKCAKTVALTKVRSALKTSWQGLLNGVKQKIPTVLIDCVPKAYSSQFFQFWGGTYFGAEPSLGAPVRTPKNKILDFFKIL